MSSSRYPDSSRYPRERSPYRDRRASTYTGAAYPPRGGDGHGRPSTESSAFPSQRDVPRGPKSLVDAPRGPPSGPPSGVPSGPRDGRGRGSGLAGRGDGPTALRDMPPLGSATHNPRDHNTRDHWRADRDRDRDFRERRPSPPRRSPIRDSRDFSLNIDRARRNSRDGPPSAGSTYSDPPLTSGSSYRGSGVGRGRGSGRDFNSDFRSRGRGYHNDERDRHHDPRDARDRMYRPRSRSRDPLRRDTAFRDDRDFERRDRDDRRFERRDEEPRRYDSYQGSASFKPASRTLDTHRPSVANEPRNLPSTPTGPSTPHSAHHPVPSERAGPPVDPYSRRSSVATEPLSAKDARRESDRNDLIASRAEFSKERYAPRASSPPTAVPAFGFSNVWRNPALDAKPTPAAPVQKPVASSSLAPVPAPAAVVQTPPLVPKPGIPAGLSTVPPTGPKADRLPDRPQTDSQNQENKPPGIDQPRPDAPSRPSPAALSFSTSVPGPEHVEPKAVQPTQSQAGSPPAAPGLRNRPPPTGPLSTLRPNVSPSFSRTPLPSYAPRDASPGAIPSGPRNALSIITSPKSVPINIPTGPKADRSNKMGSRAPMYGPPDRPPFTGARLPLAAGPKSMQWVNPMLNRPPTIPSKREFSGDDRERTFGTAPKAPKLEGSFSATDSQRPEQPKPEPSAPSQPLDNISEPKNPASPDQVLEATSPKPDLTETRRLSDVPMPDASPRTDRPPVSATSSVPEVMEDSDDDFDLDEEDFAVSEAKYNREKALLESRLVDLSATHLRANTPLQEVILLSNLSLEHLPSQGPKSVDEEPTSPTLAPPLPPESVTTELPTPIAEETDDVVMEEKPEISVAPATQALRLRQKTSVERDTPPPDTGLLPYLVSGPPTPLSDPEHEPPSMADAVLAAVRDLIRRDTVPERSPEAVLREYAATYKQWRLSVQELDQEREHDDRERVPSAEPSLKATTPDVSSSTMAAALDAPAPTTGRRGRFATEFDFEQALKESLKTAEEERAGKKDREPQKSQWDPEREARVPLVLTAYEAQRRRFVDTNFQREPGQGVFVYHYEPPEDDFTEAEHKVMVQHYRDQYAKKWGKLAEILHKEVGTSRTYKDTINHYYATKWSKEFKHKTKRRAAPRTKRGGGGGRGRAAANAERSDAHGDDSLGPLPLTDTGRPRRHAAPTFGTDAEFDSTGATPTPGRQRRHTDVEGAQEKTGRRGKPAKEKGGRKPKAQPLAAAPVPSPVKPDRKERALGVKTEEDVGKRPGEGMPLQMTPGLMDLLQNEQLPHIGAGIAERTRPHPHSRPGPSSYWSVTEQNDFHRNVAHFGTDWAAIANHMGTKTQTMVKNQYLRLVEGGSSPELAKLANEADRRRERGEDLGPPPTPTPAPKRRYESSQAPLPRALAPTPEVAELLKSPPPQTSAPPTFSPSHSTPGRFSNIAQAPPQSVPMMPGVGSGSVSETPLAALPSMPPQQSPPQPRAQPQHAAHSHTHSQQKPHLHGPRAGYFSDDQPMRIENRMPSQPVSLDHPSRLVQPQIQPPVRNPEPAQVQTQAPLFRAPISQERDPLSRLEQQQEGDVPSRFQHHSRRMSQEVTFHRQFPSNTPVSTQAMPSMRSTSGAASPGNRPTQVQQTRYVPPQPQHQSNKQQNGQPMQDTTPQIPASMAVPPQIGSRSVLRTTNPVKEEHRNYPGPTHQAQPSAYQQPPQLPQLAHQPSAPSPAPKPAVEPREPPRKSNLLSLLNDTEPEEQPRRKKPNDIPSHTPTPQQQTPIAPPPPTNQAQPQRRDPYIDASYPRPMYTQPSTQPHTSSGRSVVDLTSEQQGTRPHPRESWQQRPTFHSGQSQAQQGPSLNSPHGSLAQPPFNDSRLISNHRSLLAQHNGIRHNPSPPPHPAYNNSPHLHSRTPSFSGPPPQQHRHSVASNPGAHTSQAAASTSQILQPNPYAQVDPPGSSSQPTGPVGMRPSPHHTAIAQQREIQGRNEQSQVHNANLPYSNPQTPSEIHPAHQQHLRGPSVNEQYRARDPRELHDFDPRNHERDLSRELSQRGDVLLREQREAHLPRSAQPGHPDVRYQPQAQPDRGYPPQRSHTPLSRSEHAQNQSLQPPAPHSLLSENRPSYQQRQQDEAPHRYRETYPPRDERLTERLREEQAHHQARMRAGGEEYLNRDRETRDREMRDREMRDREMRDREMRDREMRDREMREREMREREMRDLEMRDARYREEMMRRDGRLPGPQPPQQGQHEQRPNHGPPIDWTSAIPRQQDRWQQQNQR